MLNYVAFEGTALFIGRQVCEVLGYNTKTDNLAQTLKRHCPNAKQAKEYSVKPTGARQNSALLTLDEVLTLCSKADRDASEVLLWLQNEGFEMKVINNVRDEVSFGNTVVEAMFKNYSIIRQYRVLDYRLDFYIPELNIAVEFDEEQHRSASHKAADDLREAEIKREIGCTFIRVPR